MRVSLLSLRELSDALNGGIRFFLRLNTERLLQSVLGYMATLGDEEIIFAVHSVAEVGVNPEGGFLDVDQQAFRLGEKLVRNLNLWAQRRYRMHRLSFDLPGGVREVDVMLVSVAPQLVEVLRDDLAPLEVMDRRELSLRESY